MVFQLLGFDSRMNKLGQNPAFGPAVARSIGDLFGKGSQVLRASRYPIIHELS